MSHFKYPLKLLNRIMPTNLLTPPKNVYGMKKLDKTLFNCEIFVPWIELETSLENLHILIRNIKKYFLKVPKIKPIITTTKDNVWTKETLITSDNDECQNGVKRILLNPELITSLEDFDQVSQKFLKEKAIRINFSKLLLTYDNWKADEILKAILPQDQEIVSSYSKIGHIIHLNLREHLFDFKLIIGEILLDKIKEAKTIVNKTNEINNKYRYFQMEILAGIEDYNVNVKENHCSFKFDFSKVYWNPRLGTEHARIVDLLNPQDVLYDVFAGVGPFAIPAAKKKCYVLANDLNPQSYEFLKINSNGNKVNSFLTCFNLDAGDFIKKIIKEDLLSKWANTECKNRKYHITMNLPAMAVEFIPFFKGLLKKKDLKKLENITYPIIHLYCFIKGDDTETKAKEIIEEIIDYKLDSLLINIHHVRNVAQKKDMYCVSFNLNKVILTYDYIKEPECKKICLDKVHDG